VSKESKVANFRYMHSIRRHCEVLWELVSESWGQRDVFESERGKWCSRIAESVCKIARGKAENGISTKPLRFVVPNFSC
jgi:hypothetical protein